VPLRADSIASGSVSLSVSLSTHDAEFGHGDVRVAFDNFRVVAGRLACP
jgi:hypothetical protein